MTVSPRLWSKGDMTGRIRLLIVAVRLAVSLAVAAGERRGEVPIGH